MFNQQLIAKVRQYRAEQGRTARLLASEGAPRRVIRIVEAHDRQVMALFSSYAALQGRPGAHTQACETLAQLNEVLHHG